MAILGPTASGKSSLAEYLAVKAGGELINSDASAVYRELSVGVTKPDLALREKIPHHCWDMASVLDGFDLMEYLQKAEETIQDVTQRGSLPIVVGGTGLYARALLDGYRPPQVDIPEELRKRVREMPDEEARERLRDLDPVTFKRIDHLNPRRVCRALELVLTTGSPLQPPKKVKRDDLNTLKIILLPKRSLLKHRIQRRAEQMWTPWVKEVDLLEKNGLTRWVELRKPIGYSWVLAHNRGDLSRDEAMGNIIRQTCKLAKRQQTWLNRESEGPNCHKFNLEYEEQWSQLPKDCWLLLQDFLGA